MKIPTREELAEIIRIGINAAHGYSQHNVGYSVLDTLKAAGLCIVPDTISISDIVWSEQMSAAPVEEIQIEVTLRL